MVAGLSAVKLLVRVVPHVVALAADAAVSAVLFGLLYVVLFLSAAFMNQPLGGPLALPFMVLVGLLGGAVVGAVVTGPLTLLSAWLAAVLSRPTWWSPLIQVAIVLVTAAVVLVALPPAWGDVPTWLLVVTGAVVLGAQAVVHWVFRTMTAMFIARVSRPAA